MRTSFVILLLSVMSLVALEIAMTDEQRTKSSAAVFSGMVASTEFVRELDSGALWRAVVNVWSVDKSDGSIRTNMSAVVYYEQTFTEHSAERGVRTHGRVCPGYPDLFFLQKTKLWCRRTSIGGQTNVLFVPSASWTKPQ